MKLTILFLFIITNLFSQQWVNQNPKFSESSVNDILFVNETTGFLAIGSELYKTTDGGIPSGIYFYRMQAGSFSETKKLMLIK